MSGILKSLKAAFGDVEPTPYTVVVQRGGYEERVYPARRWACTSMSGPSRHALVTPMFRRLFSYISGRNEPNLRIDMTTPVATLVEPAIASKTTSTSEEKQGPDSPSTTTTTTTTLSSPSSHPTYTMSFLVPADHQESPPSSADKNIFIEYRPRMVVLASRFSGYMNDEVEAREVAALREAIKNNGDADGVDFLRYYVVGYDPPFKLLGRRNEIWMVKTVKEAQNGDGVMVTNGAVVKGEEKDAGEVCENGNDEVIMES